MVARVGDRGRLTDAAELLAALRVNASVHDPLLCVTNVFDVASGDLSLPGEAR